MKTSQPKWYRWALAVTVIGAIGSSGVGVAQAQPAPTPATICARPQRLLTMDDRKAMAKVILDRMKERLGLTDQQNDRIRAALQSQRDEARADRQALCEGRVELRRLLEEQGSDPTALKAAAERVKTLQGKLLDRRLERTIAIRSQLTPEQWAKWIELRKGMGRRWMGRGREFAS